MSNSVVLRMTAAAVNISHKAGQIVRNIMKSGDLGIIDKGGQNNLQTEADRSAQKCIMASLHKLFPKAHLIGEEEWEPETVDDVNPDWVETSLAEDVMGHDGKVPNELLNVKEEDVVIWVDPLDGTAEYTMGLLDHVTVLIGITVGGEAVAGVMYQPYFNYKAGPEATLGRAIWGIVGIGAFGYDAQKPPTGQTIITTTRSHSNKNVVNSVNACKPTDVLRVGGAGHKVLVILEGQAHAYVFATPGCKKWDTAAPQAILHAAGGKLTDVHGNTLPYKADVTHMNSSGVIATPDVDSHKWYLEKMPQEVKDALKFVY